MINSDCMATLKTSPALSSWRQQSKMTCINTNLFSWCWQRSCLTQELTLPIRTKPRENSKADGFIWAVSFPMSFLFSHIQTHLCCPEPPGSLLSWSAFLLQHRTSLQNHLPAWPLVLMCSLLKYLAMTVSELLQWLYQWKEKELEQRQHNRREDHNRLKTEELKSKCLQRDIPKTRQFALRNSQNLKT